MGAPAPPGRKKNSFRCNLQGQFVSAPLAHPVHPQAEKESIIRTFFAVLGRFGASVCSFRPSFEGDD